MSLWIPLKAGSTSILMSWATVNLSVMIKLHGGSKCAVHSVRYFMMNFKLLFVVSRCKEILLIYCCVALHKAELHDSQRRETVKYGHGSSLC
jgi:hypothetical protein